MSDRTLDAGGEVESAADREKREKAEAEEKAERARKEKAEEKAKRGKEFLEAAMTAVCDGDYRRLDELILREVSSSQSGPRNP